MEKKEQFLEFVMRLLSKYKRPALACSFGKDSMVMLHMFRQAGIDLPVVFHRDPWWPQKYKFADRIINEWSLEVHDYAPFAVTLWKGENMMAFTNHYQVGPMPHGVMMLPKNIVSPEPGKKFLCGIKDVLGRPTGTYNYPFDLVFSGHKNADDDPIAGSVKLNLDIKLNNNIGPDIAFPLRNWTDEDVWDYTEKHSVPQDVGKYDIKTRSEIEDKWENDHYAHVCIACCDSRNKSVSVMCPKFNCEVSNISHLVPYSSPNFDYYGEGAK